MAYKAQLHGWEWNESMKMTEINVQQKITFLISPSWNISLSRCLVANGPTGESVVKIRDTEKKLADKKQHLETFQTEFCDVKKKFEEACKKLEQVWNIVIFRYCLKFNDELDHYKNVLAKNSYLLNISHLILQSNSFYLKHT